MRTPHAQATPPSDGPFNPGHPGQPAVPCEAPCGGRQCSRPDVWDIPGADGRASVARRAE